MFSSCVVLNPCDGGTTKREKKKKSLVPTIKVYRIQCCLNLRFVLQNILFCVLQIKRSHTGLQQYEGEVNDDRKMM